MSQAFKNPCIVYIPGSTLEIVDSGLIGKAESRVYNKAGHYQNGFSIGIYFDEENQWKQRLNLKY